MPAVPERLRPLLAADSPLQRLAGRFTGAGHCLYLVGGSVRDALLGSDAARSDLDLTTDARPDDVEALVDGWADSVWLAGKGFGTVGAMASGMRFEITTFRAEAYVADSRKPKVVFGDRLEDDLARRDFTVNAMALSLPDPTLVDPFGGLADLAARTLRTPLAPEVSFGEDPLRMLRAARFMATLGFQPVAEIESAVASLRRRLEIVSGERIRDELGKLIVAVDPSPGLWFLVRTGLAEEFLPELPALALEQDPIHRHKDVLAHTIAVVGKTRPELTVRLAALLHDVGKPKTRSIGPTGVSFHHHDAVGARMADERLRALRFPRETIETVTALVALHLRFHTYKMGWSDRAVRRYVRDAGALLDDLNHLVRCDCTTRSETRAKALERRMDELEARVAELRTKEELDSLRPPLDGHQVMAFLGVSPGRVVGEALGALFEMRLDEGPIEEDEAYRRLADWATERGLTTVGYRVPDAAPPETGA
ncbi:MAG: CCA tRNA nucleotidyltransferase [Acidimicrobiia bacterium]